MVLKSFVAQETLCDGFAIASADCSNAKMVV